MALVEVDGGAALAARRTVEVRKLLIDAAALETNSHFVFKSGLHSADYINKAALFTSHLLLARIGAEMAGLFDNEKIQLVIGPTVGGAMLAPWVARALSSPSGLRVVFNAFVDKVGDGYALKRGYESAVKGMRVLVCDDVTSTGGSARSTAQLVRNHGGNVVGTVAVWNRGKVTSVNVDAPIFRTLLDERVEAWEEAECPMCKAGIAIRTDLGHGAAYLAAKNK